MSVNKYSNANKSGGSKLKGEATPAIMIVAIALLVIVLSAGAFYAYNGGWKTDGQKNDIYKHEILPLLAAKRGDTEALDQENKYRKEHGQPLLEIPKDRAQSAANNKQKLEELQLKLNAIKGNSPTN